MTCTIKHEGEYADKLRLIAGLTAGELQGWLDAAKIRGFWPGEHAALLSRAKELGVRL